MNKIWKAGVIAAGLLYLIGCNRASKGDAQAKNKPVEAKIRGINVTRDLPTLSVSVAGAVRLKGIAANSDSPFTGIEAGDLQLYAVAPDGKDISRSYPFAIQSGEELNAVATGARDRVEMLLFKHKEAKVDEHSSRYAILNAYSNTPVTNVLADSKSVVSALNYETATADQNLAPGKHLIQVDFQRTVTDPKSHTTSTQTQRSSAKVDFAAGKSYTLVFFENVRHMPQLLAFEDRYTAPAPAK